jgi:uncharacterized membrane protein YgdD (TMEM256/DUF423 family)
MLLRAPSVTVYARCMSLLPTLASVSLAISVACGAFGAHALRDTISPGDLAIWEKAVLYQMVHSLGALVLSITTHPVLQSRRTHTCTLLLLLSTLIFSGSLYLLVLLQQRWLGAITPLGGTGFILAWLLLAFECIAYSRRDAK